MFGKRAPKPVEITVKSYGEDITLKLRPLSALEVDQIRNAYPPPPVPREVVDGETKLDAQNPEYQQQLNAWIEQFFGVKLCRMIGAAEFGTDNPVEQIALLKADFTESEYVALIAAANKVNAGEVTAAHMEAAKEKLVPFGSAASETESSPTP